MRFEREKASNNVGGMKKYGPVRESIEQVTLWGQKERKKNNTPSGDHNPENNKKGSLPVGCS